MPLPTLTPAPEAPLTGAADIVHGVHLECQSALVLVRTACGRLVDRTEDGGDEAVVDCVVCTRVTTCPKCHAPLEALVGGTR